ncbi:Adenosylmethionine-8-amino-7-oxononanoate aminotransferase [Bosea sp. 62]|uniref:aspartate aminotransferase family protein n=1 Tax=unclassified Bosea (in: a-proteobacteria) TaxID=2653178 RepID=UPI0012560F3F|nr:MULTISPECIES: aspartate aminotransferase family protein [unclassified Bosea (in: a-proteobacteria)]CAD5293247.1 Adenosylmethionine-8-amino-7-oxononanoate aminotransferase [Bosea sp. 7B]CAD5298604.1 Adenosylmethionine-8-amino-7-oxononanoate aminotransferase [Bosea sp. 21B]CAD5298767.1 Adenosylmethionine-8-amino-7-oxononanoate aminotransferase [Bosea sp. 46]VVT61502.1 Adenosylmethionine-8-amino-7-oxononanoate aminotransferase [Bosea sp. EC-HK365B]VXB12657.1 Adenosylmethionine-8-amino-7-oxonon
MSHILHRMLSKTYPTATGGEGMVLRDRDGREHIDASGGAAVSCLGHGHPDVLAAMHAQIDKLAYAHTSFFTTDAAEELADHLIARAPPGMESVYFCSSGSEAIEACLKMARHYFVEKGERSRVNFISRQQSYHGITLGALSVGGRMKDRAPFEQMLMQGHHISPCYEYRGRRADETSEEYALRVADELEAKILELGPETVCAFVAETVVGATLGAVPAAPGYFKRIREICDRHGVLLILDEVMSGMGRTGTLHACEQEGIAPDLMAIAKGLGGGYAPIGAMLTSKRVVEAVRQGSGVFPHSQTYVGHPLACATALAVQQVIERDDLLANVRKQGARLEQRLRERFGNHHHVGDIRGRGHFWGVEIVADRSTKTPFDPALKLNARIKQAAQERGLLIYPMGGTADGTAGDHVLLAPPFIIDAATVDTIVERLGDALDASLASARLA